MRNRIVAWTVLGVVAIVVAPSAAHAATLSKREARAQAKYFVKERVNEREWSWASWWAVERAYKCSRRNSSVVECDFDLVDEQDIDSDGSYYGCEDTVRIRETRRSYFASYPYRPDCGYWWTD